MCDNWGGASGAKLRVEDIDWAAAAEGEDMFTANADDLRVADPRAVRRAETAPMVLTIMGANGALCDGEGEEVGVDPEEEYRYTEEYHRLYYSKNPRDPRLLPPLTRRRLHLRESRAPGASPAGGGENTPALLVNGAVGDRVEEGSDGPSTVVAPTSTPPKVDPANSASGAALVKLYVETFRPDWNYQRIRGHVCSFSKDQDGSRLVQRLLERSENLLPIFEEVMVSFGELATDVFGNYVLQKMFDVVPRMEKDPTAPPELREAKLLERLTEQVRGKVLYYSRHTYGCRVMQKAVEHLCPANRLAIIKELDGNVVESIFDPNANHVVQKVIEVCPADAQFVVDAYLPSLGELACHAYGCRVLQRTFEKCHDVAGVDIQPLLEAVLDRVNEFTVHQYGNYVVQHAMLNAPDETRHRFVVRLTPQLYALSCSKFASNVAERIVSTATEEERDVIIRELQKPLSDAQGGNYLVNMMLDTYANYVIQRFFEVVSAAQRERISELVQPYIGSINQSVYGRHLLRKMVANNILTSALLLGHGIDVSGPDYGGGMNSNGFRGGSSSNAGGVDRSVRGGAGGNRGKNQASMLNPHNVGGGSGHNGLAPYAGRNYREDHGGSGLPAQSGATSNSPNGLQGNNGGFQTGVTNVGFQPQHYQLQQQQPQQQPSLLPPQLQQPPYMNVTASGSMTAYPPSSPQQQQLPPPQPMLPPFTVTQQQQMITPPQSYQQPLPQPQQQMAGYMHMPQHFGYGNPYDHPAMQPQQPQLQQQQQPHTQYMNPVPAAVASAAAVPTASFYSPQSFTPMMPSPGFGTFPGTPNFSSLAPQPPQQPPQQGSYPMSFGQAPMQTSSPSQPQLQPPHQQKQHAGAPLPRSYVNGGYSGVGQLSSPPLQEVSPSPQGSSFFSMAQQQQQQQPHSKLPAPSPSQAAVDASCQRGSRNNRSSNHHYPHNHLPPNVSGDGKPIVSSGNISVDDPVNFSLKRNSPGLQQGSPNDVHQRNQRPLLSQQQMSY